MSHLTIGGVTVQPGETRDIALEITQSYSGASVAIPVRVQRAEAAGPVLLLTAAVHGDELNGTGIIREVLIDPPCELTAGTLVLVPVVNILGFERHSRYLPDRRDLNRSFPGSASGSLAKRIAHTIFTELVQKCDFCLDLHTAAVGRTNFPNVRGDLSHPQVRRLATAFGCQLIVDNKGFEGSLRNAACKAGHPTIILEAGEVSKVEPSVLEVGLRGVVNVMVELGMTEGESSRPVYQATIDHTQWLRADNGGLLRFHAGPGEVVEAGQPIASCLTLLGDERGVVEAPEDGIIMGLTTRPLVKPGDPVCNLAVPRRGIQRIRRAEDGMPEESLHGRLLDDLASSISVEEPADGVDEDPST